MDNWQCVLELDRNRRIIGGSTSDLRNSIKNGADLRIYTEFIYGEHVEPGSPNKELVKEVSDFRVTYLIDNQWTAGIMNMRVPAVPPTGFGPRASMSFFMYNEDGQQAIARPYLDGVPASNKKGACACDDHSDMPKYHHQFDNWDVGTNAPSSNFVYDFESYKFYVRNGWKEIFSHNSEGKLINGSLEDLTDAFAKGCEIKAGISGICDDLTDAAALPHELFVHAGPGYYNTESQIFTVESQPAVRVKPAIPMRYSTNAWDFGWFLIRTDGTVFTWLCDPYTLAFRKSAKRCAVRWFVR